MNVHTRSVPTDVAILGAGAAGLAAASTLYADGADVVVLEARTRVGGRAYTVRTPDGAFPVELGAEFIHGKADPTTALLRETDEHTSPIDSSPAGIWEATERVLDLVDLNGPDRSVDEFLTSVRTEDAEQARMLIEGFDAAITADASIIAIASEWRSDVNDTRGRPSDGYGVLMEHLADPLRDRIWLNAPVREVRWSSEGVEIDALRDGEPVLVRAKQAVITLPVGVLRNEGVRFTPPLPPGTRRAIDAIGMGPVIKVVLAFRSVFWNAGFFQAPPECGFRTVWSHMPERAPILTAWAGGDAARKLAHDHPDPIAAAIDACAALFPDARVRDELEAAYYHDWQRDPYARGAYSYLRVGGGDARDRLAEPIAGVLFFAGEAACARDAGTVAGALASGYEAAAKVRAPGNR